MTKAMRDSIVRKAKRTIRLRNAGVYKMTDVNVEETAQVERDNDGFIVETDTLTFTVPKNTTKDGATAGDESELSFSYKQVDTDELAAKILEAKKWSVVDLVNRKLKADARSARYQSEMIQHKPITVNVSVGDITERMAKDFQRLYASLGKQLSMENALLMVETQLAENNG